MSSFSVLLDPEFIVQTDIANAVSILSQFLSNPGDDHWRAAKRLLRYLRGTWNYGIRISIESSLEVLGFAQSVAGAQIQGFSDSDYASCSSRRSRTGFAFFLGDTIVSWYSKKQNVVSLSTCEAEFYAFTEGGKEAIYLRRIWSEIQTQQVCSDDSSSESVKLHCDNNSAIAVVKNPAEHKMMKHVDIRHKWIQERVRNGNFQVEYVPTKENVADLFTKGLLRPRFEYLRSKCGIVAVDSLT